MIDHSLTLIPPEDEDLLPSLFKDSASTEEDEDAMKLIDDSLRLILGDDETAAEGQTQDIEQACPILLFPGDCTPMLEEIIVPGPLSSHAHDRARSGQRAVRFSLTPLHE